MSMPLHVKNSIGNKNRINYRLINNINRDYHSPSLPICAHQTTCSYSTHLTASNIDPQKTKINKNLTTTETEELIEKNKNAKLRELETCLEIIASRSNNIQVNEKCKAFLDNYRQFISIHRKDDIKYKNLYLRTLYLILDAYYQEELSKVSNDIGSIDEINSVLDSIGNLRKIKRHSLIGAILLANDQSVKFLDYLKVIGVSLQKEHVEFLCRIAQATKNPRILEPFIESTSVFSLNTPILVKFYEALALIYGKAEKLDKLESLWSQLLLTRRVRRDERIFFKLALHRIAHFYRRANKKIPEELAKELARLDKQVTSFYLTSHT